MKTVSHQQSPASTRTVSHFSTSRLRPKGCAAADKEKVTKFTAEDIIQNVD